MRSRGRGSRGRYSVPKPQIDAGSTDELYNSIKQQDDVEVLTDDQVKELIDPNASFEDLFKDRKDIIQALYQNNFDQPSKIQTQAIPLMTNPPTDVIAQAQSGSGKTIAFLTSAIYNTDINLKKTQVLICSNTRELGLQTKSVFDSLNKTIGLSVGLAIKDCPDPDPNSQIIIGTASSILFFQTTIDFTNVKMVIVDEADDQVSGQHRSSISKLHKLIPDAHYAFISATFSKQSVECIKNRLLGRKGISEIRLKRQEQKVQTISHYFIQCKDNVEANHIIKEIFNSQAVGQTVVFANTIQTTNELKKTLAEEQLSVEVLNADLEAQQRDQVVQKFRDQETKILIATNLIARGFDVPQVTLVINYDGAPLSKRMNPRTHELRTVADADTYIHRSGRAGRFGKTGSCLTFVRNDREFKNLCYICGQLGITLRELQSSSFDEFKERDIPQVVDEENPPEPAE